MRRNASQRLVWPLLLGLVIATVKGPILDSHPTRLGAFTAVDTSSLMGSPDPLPPYEVEDAFSALEFEFPVTVTNAADGSDRLFVVSQDGFIYAFENRQDVSEKKVFLDISDRIARDMFEEGGLALAFHPSYRENGEFFVYYSIKPLATRLSRFRVSADDPDRADADSEEMLLEVAQPFWNHNSGSLKFGPDGYLYVSLGDGGAANDPHGHGQNAETLLGSILRIDIDRKDPGKPYAIPPDNPFVGRGDGARPEIYALGLRNPWKMCFDRKTGHLWVADVGQDAWEEVNVIFKGGNYGWRVREGMHPFDPEAERFSDDFIDPVWEYGHAEGRSITGGAVYRGKRVPGLYGTYICADWVSGNIWGLKVDGAKVTDSGLIARGGYTVTAFGEDEAGEVYFLAFDEQSSIAFSKTVRGRLFRFRQREDASTVFRPFPRKLSETGLFASVKDHRPAAGLIPYDVSVPLWSDHAIKERFVALPEKGKVAFSERGNWDFPVGTVIVKTFSLELTRGDPTSRRRLETRLLVHNPRGWEGYTYMYNDEETEATLLDGSYEKAHRVKTSEGTVEENWYFPSRSDCNACHTQVKNHVLGLNTRQLNHDFDYGGTRENQLVVLERLGLFKHPIGAPPRYFESYPNWRDDSEPVEKLARAYLDVNCSHCHAPTGPGQSMIDLRYHMPLESTRLIGQPPSVVRLGPEGGHLIVPKNLERSEILYRLRAFSFGQMPPLARRVVDQRALDVFERWIQGMETRD